VLKEMGEPGAEMLVFMDATGGNPGLHADHGSGVIGIQDESESVWESVASGVGERVFHDFQLGWRMDAA
jgi:hypothetical protein